MRPVFKSRGRAGNTTQLGRKPAKHAAKPKAKPGPKKRSLTKAEKIKRDAELQAAHKLKMAKKRAARQTDQFTPAAEVAQMQKMMHPKAKKSDHFVVTDSMLAFARGKMNASKTLAREVFKQAMPMPGIVPTGNPSLAMDDNMSNAIAWAANAIYAGAFQQGVTFMGYPYLSELATRAEYRRISEVIATEMTRKWITIKAEPLSDDELQTGVPDEEVDKDNPFAVGQNDDDDEAQLDLDAATAGTLDQDDEDATDDPRTDAEQLAGDAFPPQGGGSKGPQRLEDNKDTGEIGEDPNALNPEEEELNDAKAAAAQEKDKRVQELEDEFERLGVRDAFKKMAEYDGFFGRAHLFLDIMPGKGDEEDQNDDGETDENNTGGTPQNAISFASRGVEDDEEEAGTKPEPKSKSKAEDEPGPADQIAYADDQELVMPIGDGQNKITMAKVRKGSFKRVKAVEAIWCYPANYNSDNPLRPDWYKPNTWFVMGKEVHASRLLTFIGREVPDMLKPAYSFGGLSLSQMAKPCVDNWLRTRQSVGDIIQAFSVFVLKTNMSTTTMEDGNQVYKRAEFFNMVRSNTGMMMLDKETEEFENVSAPLSTLDTLQSQSQEHICSVTGIPLVKYTGISPAGLNASSEGEIKVWYDWIKAYQLALFQSNLTRIFHLAQINIWGKVDPDLSYEFADLNELTEEEKANLRKIEADTDKTLIDASVIDPAESRQRLRDDADGPYAGLNVNDLPTPPAPPAPPTLMGPGGQPPGPGGKAPPGGKPGQAQPKPAQPDASVAQPEA